MASGALTEEGEVEQHTADANVDAEVYGYEGYEDRDAEYGFKDATAKTDSPKGVSIGPSYTCSSQEEERPPYWIASEAADVFFASLIVLNAIVLGIDIEIGLRSGGDSGPVLFWIQFGFLVVFVVELLLRVRAYGYRFFNPCRNAWGVFDLVIVGTSVAECVATLVRDGGESPLQAVSVMRIFRLMRIARVARLLNICPELSLLVGGLAASIQAVFWVFCMLVVLMYICALICAMELGRTDNEELRAFFGSVGSSFWTHFMVVTLEGYPGVAAAAAKESWLWYLYFVGFILFSNVVLMNLVTGIVCESIVTKAQDDELQSHVYREESRKFEEVMLELMSTQGLYDDSELTFEDFERLIRMPELREALNTLDVCLDIEDRVLWDILDEDDTGSLMVLDFIAALLRLRGSKDTLHSLVVQADVIRGGRAVRAAFEEAEAGASKYITSLCGALQSKLLHRISELQQAPACQQDQDPTCGRGRGGQRHSRQRTSSRRSCRAALQPEAVHGAAPPVEEPAAGEEVPLAVASADAGVPAAASRPSRGSEEPPPTADAPPAASRPSRISQDSPAVGQAAVPGASRSGEAGAAGVAGAGASHSGEAVATAAATGDGASQAAAGAGSSRSGEAATAAAAASTGVSRSSQAAAPGSSGGAGAASSSPAAASGSRPGEVPAEGGGARDASAEKAAAEAAAPQAMAPDQARVIGLLEELESSSTEARLTLSRLGEDLAASRSRVRELEAELARRQASRREALAASHSGMMDVSWPSQCSPRGIRELQGYDTTSARELKLLPGVEPRRQRLAAGQGLASDPAAAAASGAGAPSAVARPAAAGGDLERALHAFRRQAAAAASPTPATAAAPNGVEAAGAAAAGAAEAAGDGAQPDAQRTMNPRSECMAHRRRLEATYTSLTSPKPATAPAAGRRRGGAPRQRFLNTFHGHPPDVQSIAKAATYESSDEETGGAQPGARAGN